MKYTRDFAKKDAVVVLLCVIFVVLTGGAVGRSGREHSRMVVCSSHLRQLGVATHDHAMDTGYLPVYGVYEGSSPMQAMYAHNDPITGPIVPGEPWPSAPDGSQDPANPEVWYDDLCRNTPGADLMKNGSLEYPVVFDQACPTSSSVIRLSYGYNYTMLGSSSRPGFRPGKDSEWIKITQVQIPAETGMFCDGSTYWGNPARPWGHKPPRIGNWSVGWWEPSLFPDYTGPPTPWTGIQHMGHRKGTLVNVGFVDGHVEAVPPEELHTKTAHGQNYSIYIWLRDKRRAGGNQPERP